MNLARNIESVIVICRLKNAIKTIEHWLYRIEWQSIFDIHLILLLPIIILMWLRSILFELYIVNEHFLLTMKIETTFDCQSKHNSNQCLAIKAGTFIIVDWDAISDLCTFIVVRRFKTAEESRMASSES